ncbi:MAG: hypothetical protein ACLTS6_13165 [Anaerobutyricum sp.]
MLSRKKKLEIPVYLFMGFLEAERQPLFRKRLEEDYFNDGESTFYSPVKRGMEEYDEELLKRTEYNTCLCRRSGRF